MSDDRTHNPERTAAHLEALVREKKVDELFSQGGCFHFAQRAAEKGIGRLHCTVSPFDPTKADHVFVVTSNGLVFDRFGYRSAHDLLTERDSDPGQNREMTAAEVQGHIEAMRLPDELNRQLFQIADELIAEIESGKESRARKMLKISEIKFPVFGALDSHGHCYDFEPSAAEIQEAISNKQLEQRGAQTHLGTLTKEWLEKAGDNYTEQARLQKTYNAQRIAHFVVHGWTDPIVVAENGNLVDGSHRLRAAIHKGLKEIAARIGHK